MIIPSSVCCCCCPGRWITRYTYKKKRRVRVKGGRNRLVVLCQVGLSFQSVISLSLSLCCGRKITFCIGPPAVKQVGILSLPVCLFFSVVVAAGWQKNVAESVFFFYFFLYSSHHSSEGQRHHAAALYIHTQCRVTHIHFVCVCVFLSYEVSLVVFESASPTTVLAGWLVAISIYFYRNKGITYTCLSMCTFLLSSATAPAVNFFFRGKTKKETD